MMTTCGHSPHYARGLCEFDYNWARRNGTLLDHVRNSVSIETVIEEVEFGTIRNLSDSHRIGMTPKAIKHALYRAKRGDLVRRLKEEK